MADRDRMGGKERSRRKRSNADGEKWFEEEVKKQRKEEKTKQLLTAAGIYREL